MKKQTNKPVRQSQKSPLQSMLVINDDAEDILALQSRLPSGIQLMAASQFQARLLKSANYDLIVLDNDANNLNESKGKKTLEEIRKVNSEVEVIYTSFQPGHVAGVVYQTRGVHVIRTDTLPEILHDRFGVKVKPAVKAEKSPEVNLIVTYNDVNGYPAGVYSNGKLIILSNDKRAYQAAKQVLAEKIGEIYQNFEWRRDRDLIRNIFVYDGINGGEHPGQVAASLGHDTRMRINLLACGCEWERKTRFANSTYVNLFQVECSGSRTLSHVADLILGVRRLGVNYNQLKVPQEAVLQPSEKYGV